MSDLNVGDRIRLLEVDDELVFYWDLSVGSEGVLCYVGKGGSELFARFDTLGSDAGLAVDEGIQVYVGEFEVVS